LVWQLTSSSCLAAKVVLDELEDILVNVTNVTESIHGKLSALSDQDNVKLNEQGIYNDLVILLIF
jgi:hypothetical protein